MDGAEAGRRERDEQSGPGAHISGDGLAADESGSHEMEGVAGMEAGAGSADSLAPVAAADQEPFARFVAGVVAVQDLAGCSIAGGRGAGEVDRVGTATGSC